MSHRIGFIGAGDWGCAMLSALRGWPGGHVAPILTRSEGLPPSGHLPPAEGTIEYAGERSYGCMVGVPLDLVVVAGWNERVPADVVLALSGRLVNVHASLLPKYRGPEPLEQQLLHDEAVGGVSLHEMDAGWDSGAVRVQVPFPITPRDNLTTLFFKAVRAGRRALDVLLRQLASGEVVRVAQQPGDASHFGRIRPLDHVICSTQSRADVDRLSRAFGKRHPLLCSYEGSHYVVESYRLHDGRAVQRGTGPVVPLRDGVLELLACRPYQRSAGP